MSARETGETETSESESTASDSDPAGELGFDPAGEPDSDPAGEPEPDPPGVPATTRNRAKSAVLWGIVGGFSFLVLAQGYLLAGGDLPVGYAWLFAVAAAVAAVSSGLVYLTEHRIGSKRRT